MNGRRPGMAPVLVSLAAHAVVLAPLLAFTRAPDPIQFDTIRINMVSLPEVVEAAPPPTAAPPQPEPEPVREEPVPEARVEERAPDPPPRQPEQPRTEQRPDPRPPTPAPATAPPEDAQPTGEGLNIATEGRDFPFPDYLSNVIVQVHRYFRWNETSNPRGVIYFEILPDGSTRNIRMVQPSGNIRFDFAVQGAVETAGNRGAFGALPDGFAAPFLPVQLEVEPPR